jgi:hypothetical protein
MFQYVVGKQGWSALSMMKLSVFAIGALTVQSEAQAGDEPSRVILHWHGPPECNIASAVQEHVDRLLSASKRAGPPVSVSLSVVEAASQYRLVLETTGNLRRELVAKTCEELTKPAGVIIALAIDAEAVARAIEAATAEERGAAPADERAAATAEERAAGRTEKRATEPTAHSKQPPSSEKLPPETRARLAPPPRPPQAPQDLERIPETPPHDRSISGKTRRTEWAPHVRAAMVADYGALPRPSVGPGVFFGAAPSPLRVEVGGLLLLSRTAMVDADAGKGAEIDLIAATAIGCYDPFETGFRLAACAGIEAGQLRGQSFGISQPGRGSADWLAARTGGLIGFRLQRQLELLGQADITLRIGTSKFEIGGIGEVYRPNTVGARLALGLEFRFQ